MWLDNELTKGVYIYSAPYDKNKAVIAHVIQNIEHEDLQGYWHKFLNSYGILKKYNMLETWELPHIAGFVTANKVGKIYFIGAAGGGVEPFLGFGQYNAMITGVMAARSIAYNVDINFLLGNIRKKSKELVTLRPLLDAATNDDLDKLLTFMKTPGLRSLIYNTDIDIIKHISNGLKLVSKNSRNSTYSNIRGS
jgi:digeranylgeranylglycerophospholipid reductase